MKMLMTSPNIIHPTSNIVVEMVGTRWRAIFSVAFQITYVSGYILWSVVGYVWRDWHSNQMACFIICSPFAALVLIPPESARWLFAHGKNDEGKKVSKMIGRFNKKPLSNEVWSEVEASLENTQVDKTDQAQHTILDLFRSPILRIVTLKVFFVWPVVTMVYYGIAFNAGSLAGNIFLNNIWGGLLEMSSYALCGLTMDFFGRRLLIGITLTGSGIALVATAIVNEYADESHGLATLGVALAFAGKAFASGAFALVFTFTAELFPTSVRSNAIGFASTTARIGGIMAPFIISLQHYVTWIPNTMLGAVALMGGLVSLTIRDTTGHTMMETLEEAEIFHSGKSEPARRYDAKTI